MLLWNGCCEAPPTALVFCELVGTERVHQHGLYCTQRYMGAEPNFVEQREKERRHAVWEMGSAAGLPRCMSMSTPWKHALCFKCSLLIISATNDSHPSPTPADGSALKILCSSKFCRLHPLVQESTAPRQRFTRFLAALANGLKPKRKTKTSPRML